MANIKIKNNVTGFRIPARTEKVIEKRESWKRKGPK